MMEKQRFVAVVVLGLLVTIGSAVPTNRDEPKATSSSPADSTQSTFQFTPLTGSPPPSDLPTLNVTGYAPPDLTLTSIIANLTKGGPRANLNWIAHLIPGSNAGISILDVRVLINLFTFALSMFSMARFAVQVANALLGIFSSTNRKRQKRQLPADFFAQLFEPPVSPLPYNVTGNAGEAILDHFRLLHIDSEVCKMKVICEVMKEPEAASGIFGELVASTFGVGKSDLEAAAAIGKDTFKGYYSAAQLGRKQYDCSRAFSGCHKSFKDFLQTANGG